MVMLVYRSYCNIYTAWSNDECFAGFNMFGKLFLIACFRRPGGAMVMWLS